MSNNELFQAFGQLKDSLSDFQKGVEQLQNQRSITQANQAVDQIRNSELKDEEKRAEIQRVAGNLSSQMIGRGMPAAQAEATYSALSPKPSPIQNPFEAMAYGTPEQKQAAQDYINKEQAFKLQLARESSTIKMENKQPEKLVKQLKEFQTVNKADIDAVGKFSSVAPLLESGNNLGYVEGIKTVLKMNDQRISDADFSLALPNTSLADKAKRAYSQLLANKPLTEDVDAVKAVAEIWKKKTEEQLKRKAAGFSRTRAQYAGVAPSELEQALLTEHLPDYQPGSPSPASTGVTPEMPGSTPSSKYIR